MTFLFWFAVTFGVIYGVWSLVMSYWECPNHDDIDALVSRQFARPDKGTPVGPTLPGISGGSPVRISSFPGLRDSGEPSPTTREK